MTNWNRPTASRGAAMASVKALVVGLDGLVNRGVGRFDAAAGGPPKAALPLAPCSLLLEQLFNDCFTGRTARFERHVLHAKPFGVVCDRSQVHRGPSFIDAGFLGNGKKLLFARARTGADLAALHLRLALEHQYPIFHQRQVLRREATLARLFSN